MEVEKILFRIKFMHNKYIASTLAALLMSTSVVLGQMKLYVNLEGEGSNLRTEESNVRTEESNLRTEGSNVRTEESNLRTEERTPETEERTFATLAEAKQAVRELKRDGDYPKEGVTVLLRGGDYKLHNPLSFTAEDSGQKEAPVTYKAFPGEKVSIDGGINIKIEDLKKVSSRHIKKRLNTEVRDRVLEIDMSRYASSFSTPWAERFRGYAGWPEIYIDGEPLQISRWPNSGYATIKKVTERGSRPRHNEKPEKAGSFKFSESNPTTWDTSQTIYLGGYWCFKWYDEFIKVETIDREAKEIHLAAPHQYGIGGPSQGLYYAINILEELDRPGEYVFDQKGGKLYLILSEDVNKSSDVEISFSNRTMFSIDNSENINFEGITFSTHCGDIFKVEESSNISFKDCTFKNISSSAVIINGGSNCGLESCHIYNIGKTAVSLNGGDRKELRSSNHYVKSSHIHHFARHIKTYTPAVMVEGVGQYVGYNDIHDAPHCAILFSGNDHTIENNRIKRVCLDTSDAGAIYCGRDWAMGGNTIRRNFISNLGEASHHHNWGIYLDDMASGIEVYENIIADSPSGILVGGGRDNIIRDNLMANCKKASIIFDARAMGWAGNHIVKRSGTMWTRLDELPFKSSPWIDRFPYLSQIEGDEPGKPKNNSVTGNISLNSADYEINELVSKYGKVNNKVISGDKSSHKELFKRFESLHLSTN